MKDEEVNINGFECRMIANNGEGPCVVLLHGYMYTSDVWNYIGLLRLLENKNIPFKAVDMPYGNINECFPRSADPAKNIGILAKICQPDAVIIGASLGGYMALKYCTQHPAGGIMVVAPVMALQKELVLRYPQVSARVSIICGREDNVVRGEEIRRLGGQFGTGVNIYDNAGHAAYLDQPERFKDDVIRFYESIVSSGNI
ncbi:MAG: alpha/beta fold hydrolase [Desulfobacterales bacterium]